MRRVLHIRTDTAPPLADQLIASQRQLADCVVEVVDLSGPQPDYDQLLDLILSADSIHAW